MIVGSRCGISAWWHAKKHISDERAGSSLSGYEVLDIMLILQESRIITWQQHALSTRTKTWSDNKRIQPIPCGLPSSSDVPVLLLNQPSVYFVVMSWKGCDSTAHPIFFWVQFWTQYHRWVEFLPGSGRFFTWYSSFKTVIWFDVT